jgi:hypothetical protein
MGKKLITDEIENLLQPPLGQNNFTEIFTKILHWRSSGNILSKIAINPDGVHEFLFSPVAEIGGVSVFLAELSKNDFPNTALLILTHRDISKKFPYCILIFISSDKTSALLCWGKYRSKTKTEIRTCIHNSTNHSSQMALTLSELLIDLSETDFDEPHTFYMVDKINTAFLKESDITDTFSKLSNQLKIIREKYTDAAEVARKNLDYKTCNKFNTLKDKISELSKNIARDIDQWNKLIK